MTSPLDHVITTLISEPPVLALEEILYVEVNLERPLVSEAFKASTDFAVVLEHCWGTPHNNRDGDMKYYIIKNQCPVKGKISQPEVLQGVPN